MKPIMIEVRLMEHKEGDENMDARMIKELDDKLCKELEQIMKKQSFNMGDIESIDKITHSMKSLKCLEEKEMSGRRRSYAGDPYQSYWGSYGEGSYRDDSYDSYGSSNRSMRGYSNAKDDVMQMMKEKIEDDRLPSNDRNAILRAMEIMKR